MLISAITATILMSGLQQGPSAGDQAFEAAKKREYQAAWPVAVLTMEDYRRRGSQTFSVYGLWTGQMGSGRDRSWIIRRDRQGETNWDKVGYSVLSSGPTSVWADSRTCPGVNPWLEAIETVSIPRVRITSEGGQPNGGIVISLWNRNPQASTSSIEIHGQIDLAGLPTAALDDCWQATAPGAGS